MTCRMEVRTLGNSQQITTCVKETYGRAFRRGLEEAAEKVVGQAFQPVMNTISAKWRLENEQVWQTGMSTPRGRCQSFSSLLGHRPKVGRLVETPDRRSP